MALLSSGFHETWFSGPSQNTSSQKWPGVLHPLGCGAVNTVFLIIAAQDCANQEKYFHHFFPGVQTWDFDAPEDLELLSFLSVGRNCAWEPKLSQKNCVSSAGICSITPLEIQRHKWINNSCFLVFFICMPGIWWCFSRSVLRKNFRVILVILSLHAPATSRALYKISLKSGIWHGDLLQCEFNQ